MIYLYSGDSQAQQQPRTNANLRHTSPLGTAHGIQVTPKNMCNVSFESKKEGSQKSKVTDGQPSQINELLGFDDDQYIQIGKKTS